MNIRGELEYLLERKPTDDEVSEAGDWMLDVGRLGVNLSEWVEAMIEIGAL